MSVDTSPTESRTDARLDDHGGRAPVLVLRRSLGDLQHCVLSVARSLGRLDVPVYAARQHRREPATRSRYLTGDLKLTAAASDEWVDQLMAVDSRLNGGILLPIDDVAAITVGDHQDRLSSRFRLPMQPPGIARRLGSKLELVSVCQELGVPSPESKLLTSPEEGLAFAERFGWPLVLKRDVAWGGVEDPEAPSVLVVDRQEHYRQAYDAIRNQSPEVPNVLAQEYIPGGSDSIWMFNGYFDGESRCLCAFTGQKIRQAAHGAGQTTLGICTHNQTVRDLAIQLMEGIHYRGVVDMGFRFDARDGLYKLLDVNPRVGSTFRLFSAADGTDVVRMLYADLTGAPTPEAAFVEGRTWLDEPRDTLAALRLVRARSLSLPRWARSVGRANEFAWWAKDDPLPFFAMAAHLPRLAFHFRNQQR